MPETERLPRQLYELEPTDTPETREEAVHMAQQWGTKWSHWNEMAEAQNPEDASSMVLARSQTHVADAAEVTRLVALASVLPTHDEKYPPAF